MANKLYEESHIRNIADALRLKQDASLNTFTVAQMSQAVQQLSYSGLEDYYYAEVTRVLNNILEWKKDRPNTLIFGAVSDIHVLADPSEDKSLNSKTSIRHAAFYLENLGKLIPCDFIVNLGDNCWENGIDTDYAYEGASYSFDALRGAFSNQVSYAVPGNHDKSDDTQKQFNLIGAWNNFDDHGITQIRGYGYKDWENKKIRIICLNDVDYLNASGGYGMSYEQKDWLMRALDLSSKTEASEWNILILSHFPLDFSGGDYNTGADLKTILDGYANGQNISITVNSSYALNEDPSVYPTYSSGKLIYNYSGKNMAKIIANIHGHVHTNAHKKMADNGILRMATPNTCFYLNKTDSYTDHGDYSITEDEAAKLVKTTNTAKDTSVMFYCMDLDKEIAQVFACGAGADITEIYGDKVYHKITYILSGCTLSNMITLVEDSYEYNADIILDEGYYLDDTCVATITMGGVDISQRLGVNTISIPDITGDVVITIIAKEEYWEETVSDLMYASRSVWDYINSAWIRDIDNSSICFGVTTPNAHGFKDRLEPTPNDIYMMPIPRKASFVEITENVNKDFVYSRFILLKEDANGNLKDVLDTGKTAFASTYTWEKGIADYILINIYTDSGTNKPDWEYPVSNFQIRFANSATGPSVPIYSITNNLTHVTSNNSNNRVMQGESYTATLSVANGYTLDSVKVTMGGVDITATCYENNQISIPAVTGDIVITIIAKEEYWEETIDDLAVSLRRGWWLRPTSTDAELEIEKPLIGLGVTTPNVHEFYNEATSLTYYAMPIPEKASVLIINNTDGVEYEYECCIAKENDSGQLRLATDCIYITSSNGITCSWTKGVGDYILVDLRRIDRASISWDYDKSQISAKFANSATGTTVNTYLITNNLTNVVSDNTNTSITEGESYSATLTASSGYTLGTVSVTMGGTDITSSCYANGQISISNVTGNIVITATGNAITYTVTNTLTNVTTSNSAKDVTKGSSYTANLTASSGYELGTVKVTMGGTDITSTSYSNGKITIPNVTGNIVITATGTVVVTYTITNNLTNVTSSNSTKTVVKGSSYSTNLTASAGYTLDTVKVTMGGTDVTSSSYSNGKVTISSVTGNIVITATAIVVETPDPDTPAYTNLFSATDPDFSDKTRFGRNGENFNVGGADTFVSGYIAAVKGDIIRVYCPGGDYNNGTGLNVRCICTYDSSKTNLSCKYPGDLPANSVRSDGLGFSYTITDTACAFVRVSGHPYGNYANFVVTKNEEIVI